MYLLKLTEYMHVIGIANVLTIYIYRQTIYKTFPTAFKRSNCQSTREDIVCGID